MFTARNESEKIFFVSLISAQNTINMHKLTNSEECPMIIEVKIVVKVA